MDKQREEVIALVAAKIAAAMQPEIDQLSKDNLYLMAQHSDDSKRIAKLEAAIKEHSEPVAHVRGQDSLPNAFGKVTRELYIQEIFSKLIPPEGTELYTHPILEK